MALDATTVDTLAEPSRLWTAAVRRKWPIMMIDLATALVVVGLVVFTVL